MIVCDTGPLVALANVRDEHYFTANNLFRDLFMAGEEIALLATVLAEISYWLNVGDQLLRHQDGLPKAGGRRILVDLLEENLIHLGQVDLLRESIDGRRRHGLPEE